MRSPIAKELVVFLTSFAALTGLTIGGLFVVVGMVSVVLATSVAR